MSAWLKLKRIKDRINGVMKMAQKAQYERDEIIKERRKPVEIGFNIPGSASPAEGGA